MGRDGRHAAVTRGRRRGVSRRPWLPSPTGRGPSWLAATRLGRVTAPRLDWGRRQALGGSHYLQWRHFKGEGRHTTPRKRRQQRRVTIIHGKLPGSLSRASHRHRSGGGSEQQTLSSAGGKTNPALQKVATFTDPGWGRVSGVRGTINGARAPRPRGNHYLQRRPPSVPGQPPYTEESAAATNTRFRLTWTHGTAPAGRGRYVTAGHDFRRPAAAVKCLQTTEGEASAASVGPFIDTDPAVAQVQPDQNPNNSHRHHLMGTKPPARRHA